MIQFTMPLSKDAERPITLLKNWYGLKAMIDTGSLFPVWVGEENVLSIIGGQILSQNVEFGGFGGNVKGNLYKLPVFRFGELIYPGFHIITCRMELPCQIILPATMFKKLRYEVDDENSVFNVTVPDSQWHIRNLIIEDKNGKLHVLCTSGDSSGVK